MKLIKILVLISLITVLSLLYVYQQTEIFKLAYKIEQDSKEFKDLVDRNKFLVYDLNVLKSSPSIANRLLARESDLEISESSQLVVMKIRAKDSLAKVSPKSRPSLFGFMNFETEAEAKTNE